MLSLFIRSSFVATILMTQGCGVENEQIAVVHSVCESNGMTFGTNAYWRCRTAGDEDRKENQVAAFYMLMGAVQVVSNHQAAEIERFRKGLQEASSAEPPAPE